MIISKEQWKEYQELKEVAEEYKQISIMHYNRPYAKRYLKESKEKYKKETGRNLLYPDSEEIYKNYYEQQSKLKKITKRIRKAIDNDEENLLYVLFDIQDIIADEEEEKMQYDKYIKPYIEEDKNE